MVRVRFDVQAATRWGEVVGVVGNEPALGSWLPERAIILAPNAYPTWSGVAEIAVEGAPTDIEYKYIVRGANNEYRWEARIDNRRATVSASDEDQQVRDEADWPGVT